VVLVLLFLAPDAMVLPEPAQDLWPIPRFVLPALDITLVGTEEMKGWTPVPLVVTAEEVRTDVWLWRRLFFHNWDRFPTPLRVEGLTAMLSRFRRPLLGPPAWDHMDAGDWDLVPQPVRAMAVFGMTDCWQGHYRPGRAFGVDAPVVRDRLHAIAMAESWFVHRAVQENDDGTRDLGITQASEYARNRIRVLHIRGESDFGLAEDDYFDPWKATRALVCTGSRSCSRRRAATSTPPLAPTTWEATGRSPAAAGTTSTTSRGSSASTCAAPLPAPPGRGCGSAAPRPARYFRSRRLLRSQIRTTAPAIDITHRPEAP
jgi:hypothetical protein